MNAQSHGERGKSSRLAARRFFPLFLLAASAFFLVAVLYWRLTSNAPTDVAATEDALRRNVAESLNVETGERKAFLVAADDYGSKASALPGAKRDVEALRARLLEIGFEERNVVTLQTARTDDGAIDFDLLPQKAKIEERFKAFVDNLKPGDFAFVFLSGHGLEASRTNEAFFVPIDFDPEKPLATSVSVDAMTAALAKSAAKFRWFAVDACRSRSSEAAPSLLFASRSADATPLSEIANIPASVVMLQSCRSGQSSYEGGLGEAKDIANGFFTLSLLEALDAKEANADANKDGVASFLEICHYVTKRTNDLAQTYYKREQEPTLSGADITDFPFLTGLLVDGLPYDEWKRANDAFEAAKASRLKGEYEAALDKLALALQIAPENETYAMEKRELRLLIAAAKAGGAFSEETTPTPTLTPEEAKARYLEGRRMAWGLDGTNVCSRRAFIALRDAAENGCVEAAGELAYFYFRGVEGKNVDYQQAKFWAEKGAEINDPIALTVMSEIYKTDAIVEPDEEKTKAFGRRAYEEFRRRAELGDVVANYCVGKYRFAIAGEPDDEAARRIEEAAKAGLPAAMRAWGLICLYGLAGREKSDEKAENLFRLAAERGDALAMALLGECFRFGWGKTLKAPPAFDDPNIISAPCAYDENGFVTYNSEEALEWYCKAAELGDTLAMTALGDCWARGYGVEQNAEQAVVWYCKAAELGDTRAMTALGDCYASANVVEQNSEEALEWYRKAAELGDPRAMTALGDCYANGNLVNQNPEQAVVWYCKAAELGDTLAMTALGDFWARGYGVEQNAEQAVVWYLKATELGDFIAKEKLARCYEEGFGVLQDAEKANELRRRFNEAVEAAGGETSEIKINLDDFKNDAVPLKID